MRVGVITLFYNNLNYGGNLQAFALCEILRKKDICAEQILFDSQSKQKISSKILKLFSAKKSVIFKKIIKRVLGFPIDLMNVVKSKIFYTDFKEIISVRKLCFEEFKNQMIPNSGKVYNRDNIASVGNRYDLFITGSDQVWNLSWYNGAYFLDFVSKNRIKVSYAASLSMKELNEEQKKIIEEKLADFSAISVREERSVELLSNLTDKQVELVLDPTLLLEYEDWEKICSDRIIREDYVFCYFLGKNKNAIKLAEKFARKNKLKIVTIPYATGICTGINIKNADYKLIDVSPQKFLSLIKNASYIFTDSFHAVIFSVIFKKQFFVFNRDKKGSMSTRICTLTKLFELENRFCKNYAQETLDYINSLKKIDYSVEFKSYEEAKIKSIKYLDKIIHLV